MKLRIAALALALAFVASPALASMARACPPCADQSAGAPCSSFMAVSCCGGAVSAPVRSLHDAPSVLAIADAGVAIPIPAHDVVVRAPHELAARTSPLRLSVVRRL
jgi:hypothetical protein